MTPKGGTRGGVVLHVAPSLDNAMGGSVHAALQVCKMLIDGGQEVEVAATVGPQDQLDYLTSSFPDVPYRLFRRRFPHHNFNSNELRRWLAANVGRYALADIHGVNSFAAVYATGACRRAGVPHVVRPHGSLDPFDLAKHRLLKAGYGPVVLRRMLDGADAVVLTSALEAERMRTFGARPRIAVMPLPVHPPPTGGDGPSFRRRHGIPQDARVVLFLGRLDHKKGLQFLIPALAALKASFDDLWFVLAGSGEAAQERTVTALLEANGVGEWTTRCGFLAGEDKQSALAASDVFALPSLFENFGIVVVEAMGAGLALLLSEEVYIHDVIVDGGAAEHCRPCTASCRDGLRRLLADRARMAAMGARAREVAESRFSIEAAREPLVRLYADVVAGHERMQG